MTSLSTVFVLVIDPALWLLFIIASGVVLARALRHAPRISSAALAATVTVGVFLTIALCPSRVGDITNHNGSYEMTSYGGGIEAIEVLLSGFSPPTDDLVAQINLVAAAGSIVMVFALATLIGCNAFVAHTAALLMAVSPINLRFNFTFERYPLFLFTMLSGLVYTLSFLRSRHRADLFAAVPAFTLAGQCRPEGFIATLLGAALVIASWDRVSHLDRRSKRRLALAAIAHVALLALPLLMMLNRMRPFGSSLLLTNGTSVFAHLGIWDPQGNLLLNWNYTPFPWALFAIAGIFSINAADRRLWMWLLLSAAALTSLPAPTSIANYQRANARYFLASLPFYYILVASGFDAALLRLFRRFPALAKAPTAGGARLLSSAALAGLAGLTIPGVLRDTTADQEYRFLQHNLWRVPDGCMLATVDAWGDRGLRAAMGSMAERVRRNQKWTYCHQPQESLRDLIGNEKCAVFYLPANCYVGPPGESDRLESPEKICADRMEEVGPAIVEADLTNAPFRAESYRGDTLHVGLYWVVRPGAAPESAPAIQTTVGLRSP